MEAMIKEAIPNVTDFRYVEAGSVTCCPYGTRPCWLCRIFLLLKVNRHYVTKNSRPLPRLLLCREYVGREGFSPHAFRPQQWLICEETLVVKIGAVSSLSS